MTETSTIYARAAEMALEFKQKHLEPFAGERLQFFFRVIALLGEVAETARPTDEQLVADGLLPSAGLDRLERELGASIRRGGLGHVEMPIHNQDLGALLAEVRHWRGAP